MLIRFLFALLILSCIFDSSDLIFGLKVPIFLVLMAYSCMSGNFSINNKRLQKYVFVFSILLPITSFIVGFLTNMENYDNPNMFGAVKPYLFLFLAFAFQKNYELQEDVIKILAYSLFGLSIATLSILILYLTEVVPCEVLYEFGDQYVLYSVGERSYGAFNVSRVYFHSSPMLVFALCYFLDTFIRKHRKIHLYMSIIISASLIFSGTRNNMIMALLPYFVLYYIHGDSKIRFRVRVCAIGAIAYLLSQELVMALFDKTETSNSTKLGYFADYEKAFSNIRTLIFGDGLDSYFHTGHRGRVNVTELTYVEMFRRFGIFGACIYLYLMIKPAKGLFRRVGYEWLGLAYSMYLVMIMSNPFFFSSNGMAILSVVLVVFYRRINKNTLIISN